MFKRTVPVAAAVLSAATLLAFTSTAAQAATPPSYAATPAKASKYFFKSWQIGSVTKAKKVATKAAIKTLFKVKYDPNGVPYYWQGCAKETKGYTCAYSYEGGAMFFTVHGSKTKGYKVYKVGYIAD